MKVTSLRIRGYHCDAYGHVNNARYLELLEEARWKFLEPAIQDKFIDESSLLFVVVSIAINFKRPLLPNQWIDIHIDDLTFKHKSISLAQTITDSETNDVCSNAQITFVLLDAKTQKPTTITSEIQQKFNQLLI